MEDFRPSLAWVKRLSTSIREAANSRDRLTRVTVILLSVIAAIQVLAMGSIFVIRAFFGSHFDPVIYSDYQVVRSDASVKETLGLKEAEEARKAALTNYNDSVSLAAEKAVGELDQAKMKQREKEVVVREAEKKADLLLQEAEIYWKYHNYDLAVHQVQLALEVAPNYMPAIRRSALYSEERKEWANAKLQWEKAASIASPKTPEMEQIQKNLQRVGAMIAGTERTSVFFSEIKRTDLPLETIYDLRFNLDIIFSTRGSELPVDPDSVRVEAAFYDQSISAAGITIPVKVVSSVLRPKESSTPSETQKLSLNYSVPRGYFRRHMQNYGASYGFCGYTLKLYYRGILRDSYAKPESTLEKYALASSPTP